MHNLASNNDKDPYELSVTSEPSVPPPPLRFTLPEFLFNRKVFWLNILFTQNFVTTDSNNFNHRIFCGVEGVIYPSPIYWTKTSFKPKNFLPKTFLTNFSFLHFSRKFIFIKILFVQHKFYHIFLEHILFCQKFLY